MNRYEIALGKKLERKKTKPGSGRTSYAEALIRSSEKAELTVEGRTYTCTVKNITTRQGMAGMRDEEVRIYYWKGPDD